MVQMHNAGTTAAYFGNLCLMSGIGFIRDALIVGQGFGQFFGFGHGERRAELFLFSSGFGGAVRQAVRAAIDVGKTLLGALGDEPKSTTTPYI